MKNIQLVDLRNQYLKIKSEVDQAIMDVVDNTAFINGPAVGQFQAHLESYLNVRHVIPCANGTDALQIALMTLGLKPGDEVITPSFTYIATVEVIALLGLTPRFVEVDPHTFTIDPQDFEANIGPKTKAVIPVHLYGQCANMEAILEIAKKHGIAVVEDTAQAIGAEYTFADGHKQKAGTIGDIGCTSFFPSKNLGCFGDGGAIMTNNDELAKRLRMISNHGQSTKYYHDDIGVNSRLDSIQAAVLDVKLKHLDAYCAERQAVAAFYNKSFADVEQIETPQEASYSSHVYHQYTMKLQGVDRDALLAYLHENGVPANVYYPVPIHLQKGYKEYGHKEGDFPLTERLCKQVISLPMHTELEADQKSYIINHVKSFIKK